MSLYDLIVYVADETKDRRRVISVMESAGAIGPTSAQTLSAMGVDLNAAFQRLIVEGRVREGAPGHFYLFDTRSQTQRERRVKMIGFYAILILIPIVLILLNRR